MISVSNLSVSFGKKTLFENVSIKFKKDCRYGIIGANGSGKSTFLKILAGLEHSSSGSVSVDRDVRVGFLKQDHFEYEEETVMNTVLRGNEEFWKVNEERDRIYSKEEMSEEDGIRAGEIEELFADLGGYEAESRAGELLTGLGIPTNLHKEKMSVLTGGFKLRVLLAQVLFQKPDVMLLDEPTNHLDIRTIAWLENMLKAFEGVILTISHDRHFINSISTHIADFDYGTIKIYPGNYDDFMEASTLAREQLMTENRRKQEKIAELQEFVNRFSANASKAKQATSRARQIEKIQLDDIKASSRISPYIRFKVKRPPGKEIINAQGISKTYDHVIFKDIDIAITKGERIGIIGTNGVGKTTLLKCLMKELEPDTGSVKWGESVTASYFPQDQREAIGEDKNSLIDWLYSKAPPGTDLTVIRSVLGRMLFSGDMAQKSTSVLSGGEKSRLIIGKMILSEDNLLALDEPTNHLDMESIEALNYALSVFEGTVIFVSHDREFVSSLATRIIEVTPNGINDFTGTYDEFLEKSGGDFFKRSGERAAAGK